MPRVALLLAVALASAAIAGCVEPATPAPGGPGLDPPGAELVAPAVDAKATLAEVKSFSEGFPMRRGDNEAHKAARAYLEKGFREMGYSTVFQDEFIAPVSATSTPTNVLGSGRLANVCAAHWGASLPQEWIVVGAHFDVTDAAVHGAYDDGSGTIIVKRLAEAFANVTTARTILFCEFDGEEQGLRGSTHMMEAISKGEWVLTNGSVVGMIDFDMAGIMYPAPPPLVADVRSPEMKAVIQAKAATLGIPEAMVQYRAISGGNSDNGPFKNAEVPSVLFISDFDDVRAPNAPTKLPGNYPFWHRADTYDGMVQMAGGQANLEKGFQNVIDIGSDLLFRMASGMALTFE